MKLHKGYKIRKTKHMKMKPIHFIKNFVKENKIVYLLCLIPITLGMMLINIKQNKMRLNVEEFILQIPTAFLLFTLMVFIVGIFLFYKREKNLNINKQKTENGKLENSGINLIDHLDS